MKKKLKNPVKVFYKPENHYYAGSSFILYHGFNEVEKSVLEEMKSVPAFNHRIKNGLIEIHDEVVMKKDVEHTEPVEVIEDEAEKVVALFSIDKFSEASASEQKEMVESIEDIEMLDAMFEATEFKTVKNAIEKKLGE